MKAPSARLRGGMPSRRTGTGALHTQIPTIVSLLKPEYQQRTVQEVYHQMRGQRDVALDVLLARGFHAPLVPGGRLSEHYVIATPDFVQVRPGRSKTSSKISTSGANSTWTDVAKGGVPRLGPPVPRWYGETIGFWDKDVLITWTSNIQGWKSHSEFEFSNKMQSVEIYTPIRKDGKFIGLNHEAVLYDDEALVRADSHRPQLP